MVLVIELSAQTARPLAAHANLALYVPYQRRVGPRRSRSDPAQNREPSLTSIKVVAYMLERALCQALLDASAEDNILLEASPALFRCCPDSGNLSS